MTKPKRVVIKPKRVITKQARARQLHRAALRHNWDDGLEALDRIVADRHCDHGTALAIYWMGAPGYDQQYVKLADVDSWRRPTSRFLRRLEKRLLGHDFKTSAILFNPRFDRSTISEDGHDWTAEYSDIKVRRPIPATLEEPSCPDPVWAKRQNQPAKNSANRLT